MILLHLILAGVPDTPEEDLLKDVEKSLDIFESMRNIVVARRCAEMIREVLDVTRECLRRRGPPASGTQDQQQQQQQRQQQTQAQMQGQGQLTSPSSFLRPAITTETGNGDPSALHYATATTPNNQDANSHLHTTQISFISPTSPDGNFSFSLFGQEFQPDTRAEILANLVDPMILGNFAFGGGMD